MKLLILVIIFAIWLVYRYFKVKKFNQAFERTIDVMDNYGSVPIEQLQYDAERAQNLLRLMELRENGVLNEHEFLDKLQTLKEIDQEMSGKFVNGLSDEQMKQFLEDNEILQENESIRNWSSK